MMAIKINNKLEILPGNKILVPGCEPTSAFTSPTLAENRECKAAVVDLSDAIEAIPEAKIIAWRNPLRRFFILPDGPPPNPDKCSGNCERIDYYKILRGIGTEVEVSSASSDSGRKITVDNICKAFPLKGIF